MIVNGTEDGPVINISSGCHGDEYEGGEAIRRIYREIDSEGFRGALIGVPVMNPLAFESGTRLSPVDYLNLNRVFPGKERGFLTERLAYLYINEVAKQADYIIDLHGGGNIQSLAPMAIYRDIGGDDTAKRAWELVRSTGIEIVWKGSGGWSGPIALEGQKIGIPAITVEFAGEGRAREEIIQKFEKLIKNVFRFYRMIDGRPTLPKKLRHFEGSFINSVNGGFYQQKVEILQEVKKGELLGTISNHFGEITERILCPFDGIVMSKRTFGSIEPCGWTLMVGKLQ
jgi:predicted deacylase